MAALSSEAMREVLAGTTLFSGLTPNELTHLAGLAAQRVVVRGELVVRRGDPGTSLLILVRGRLRAGAVSAEGREVTHTLMEAGTVLGEIALLDGRARSLDVTAMTEGALLVLERAAFLPFLLARPPLMLRLMGLLCDRLRRSSAAFEDVALLPLPSRLARLLLDMAEEHGRAGPDGTRIRLRLSQRDLSARVAATRERVNKQLRLWHEQGVLGEAGGEIVVRRPEALRALLD